MPSAPVPGNPEIVIIGAGAAGIGAGLALTRLGIPFVILEAKPRPGGRAFTESTSIGQPWDHGAQWFHAAERNPLRLIAERIGHPFLAKDEDWATQWHVDGRALSPVEQKAAGEAMETAFEASEEAGAAGRDISQAAAADLSPPYGLFSRFVFEAIGSGPADDMSAVDVSRYDGGETDYAVTGGYGRLIARLGEGLAVRLGCEVEAIASAPGGISIATAADGTIRARAAIVTVSNNVLLSGRIRIDRTLPAALEGLPCGDCEKIALELTGDALAGLIDEKILCQHGSDVFSLQVQPYGRRLVSAYVAGETARRVGGLSHKDAGGLLGDVLAAVYGGKIRASLGRAHRTGWSRDPHILGAYSYARAGHAADRPALLTADLAPLFLAGEAHLLDWFSTAHGAHVSGVQTAHKAARHLGHKVPEADPLWLPDSLGRSNSWAIPAC